MRPPHVIRCGKESGAVRNSSEIFQFNAPAANQRAMGGNVNVIPQRDASACRQKAKWIDPYVVSNPQTMGVDNHDRGMDLNFITTTGRAERFNLPPG